MLPQLFPEMILAYSDTNSLFIERKYLVMFAKFKRQLKNRKKGFNMMEILACVAIIVMVSTTAFFVYEKAIHTSRIAQMHSDMEAISTGCLTYETLNINSQLPTSLADLATGLEANESIDGLKHDNIVRSSKAADGNFVDPWGKAYEYDATERTLTCTPSDPSGKAMDPVVRYF